MTECANPKLMLAPAIIAAFLGCAATEVFAQRNCNPVTLDKDLQVRPGYMEFIKPEKLKPFKDALPTIRNAKIQALMRDENTMWYGEDSMVFAYQDSLRFNPYEGGGDAEVTGLRANCVGRMTGERATLPQIRKLLNYFGPDYRFRFPFRKAAGTDNVADTYVLNFWAPPRVDGVPLPVKWWQTNRWNQPKSQGRYEWVFPVGTVVGEVLYEKASSGAWYVFEVRTRERFLDGWKVNLFRPFRSAAEMAVGIKSRRPDWESSDNLRAVVAHLQNNNTLVSHRVESPAFQKVFPPVAGALDPTPKIDDQNLVIEMLTQTPFVSAEGMIWKENATMETYGPASVGAFGIAPAGYEMGLYPVNEVSCNRCHEHTGHPLIHFDSDVAIYGEMWGGDRIFTWHLFQPTSYLFATWAEVEYPAARQINPKMVQAGLIKNEKPAPGDSLYKPLPVPYNANP